MSFIDRLKAKAKAKLEETAVLATDDEAAARMAICLECPAFRSSNSQCRECGCIMTLKTKLAGSECPLGKW